MQGFAKSILWAICFGYNTWPVFTENCNEFAISFFHKPPNLCKSKEAFGFWKVARPRGPLREPVIKPIVPQRILVIFGPPHFEGSKLFAKKCVSCEKIAL